jgi:hypothetical protein
VRRALFAVIAALTACGARSVLDVPSSSGATDDTDAGLPHSSVDSGSPPADDADVIRAVDASDATDEADASSICSTSPWVIFALANDSPDQGPLSNVIYAIRADGTGGHALALPHPSATFPSVSAVGTSMVTTLWDRSALYVFSFGATSDARVDTLTVGDVLGGAALSPDGSTVVYTSGSSAGLLALAAASGASTGGATFGSGGAALPIYAPGAQEILCAFDSTIASVSLPGGVTTALIDDVSQSGSPFPTVSPDGMSLATVIACLTGGDALRVYSLSSLPAECTDGRVVTAVPNLSGPARPSWGPDDVIAYSDGQDIWLVPGSGGTPMKLTAALTGGPENTVATSPTWAPACTPL